MKKYILILGLAFIYSYASAQLDTVRSALLVQPVVVNALKKDTCFQVTWSVFGVSRNDTSGANSYVQLYDMHNALVGNPLTNDGGLIF